MYIDKPLTFLGEKEGWQRSLLITHLAANSMLFFSIGKKKKICTCLFMYIVLSFSSLSLSLNKLNTSFLVIYVLFVVRQVEKEQPDGTLLKQVR